MNRSQLNILNVGILLLIVGLALMIYFSYSYNTKKQQEYILFQNYLNNLQDLVYAMYSFPYNYIILLNIPEGVLVYKENNSLIFEYYGKNFSIILPENVSLINKEGKEINFYINPPYIIINVSTPQPLVDIFNIIGNESTEEKESNNENNNENNNNNQMNKEGCLFEYNGQKRFFWGNVNGKNYLPPVQNQGICGNCWANAAANLVASVYMIRNDKPNMNLRISRQEITVCCNYGSPYGSCRSFGCDGGYPVDSFISYMNRYGVSSEDENPYRLGNCPSSSGAPRAYNANVCGAVCEDPSKFNLKYKIKSADIIAFSTDEKDTETIKKYLLCYGPIAISGCLISYFGYDCGGHAVLLVGFDDNSEICRQAYGVSECWIIQNSWGSINGRAYGYIHRDGFMYVPYCDIKKTPFGCTFPVSAKVFGFGWAMVGLKNVTI